MRNKRTATLAIISVLPLLVTVASADETPEFKIAGRVMKHGGSPMAGVGVRLFDERGDLLKSDRSEHDGSFELLHRPAKHCALEVIPDEETGLAMALIDNVPGDRDRNFIVELHPGVQVSGRVEFEGKGLKGLHVKVLPFREAGGHTDVHGGGFAVSGKDGKFHLNLTPGPKIVHIYNERYADVVAETTAEITVPEQAAPPDVVLALHRAEHK